MMTLTASIRRARRRALVPALLVLVALTAVLALVAVVPAGATEATEEAPASTEAPSEGAAEGEAATTEGEGAAEEGGKLTISDNPHDQFGLVLFALGGLAGAAMLANAVKQLKGQRPAADGRIRWR